MDFRPSKVIWLECADEELTKRFEALEEADRTGSYADEEAFQAKLAEYQALQEGAAPETTGKPAKGAVATEPDKSARELFEKAAPEVVMKTEPGAWPDTSKAIREAIGQPQNFHGPGHLLSDDWVEPVEEVIIDEPLAVPPKIAAIRKLKAEKEGNKSRDDEIKENQTLFDGAAPLRQHLLEVAMPAVTEALVLACEEQPADAIEFVQKFLFEYEERENRAKVAQARELKAKAKADIAKEKAEQEKAKREGKAKK